MSADPILRLAMLRVVKLSADLEVLLATKKGGGIVIEILSRLKRRAAESMVAMATCQLTVEQLVTHQNEIKRYDEFFGAIRDIVVEGKQYDQQLSEADREETLELLAQSPEGLDQAIALGLIDDQRRG